MARVQVTPIAEADLPAVGRFLNEHLNGRIHADEWVRALKHPWCASRPNYGFQAHDGDRLVGAFCAIYSDQVIENRVEKFCNPHSWYMLDDYRGESVALPLHIIRQRGYNFTMLTPNAKVAEIFLHLGFRNLDDEVLLFPNLPLLRSFGRSRVLRSRTDDISEVLPANARRDFEAHREIPWLRFVAFGADRDVCLVVYKPDRWKRMPCCRIIDISDPAAFHRHFPLLTRHLIGNGLLVSRVERRFLATRPPLAHSQGRKQPKLFLSEHLKDSQIRDLYSELVALPL